jgi:putative transposase
VYNQAVAVTRRPGVNYDDLKINALRTAFMSKSFVAEHEWMGDVPYDVRDNALRDIDKARKALFAKRRKARTMGAAVEMSSFKFRSRRDKQQTLVIRGRDWGRKRGAYASLFGVGVLRTTEPVPATLAHDFRLVLDRLGHYYICIPCDAPTRSESQAPTSLHSVVALDPGVRTFQTCYDADGAVVEWGEQDMASLFQECYAADRLQGRMGTASTKTKRRRRRRAWLRKLVRIQDKIGEVHKKMAAWLCDNYRVVLIPKFETQQMVKRGSKLHSKTARGMCTWAHFRFRQRLLSRAELSPWCRVIVCDEAYTSKTCGRCGKINYKLGANKTFTCTTCGYEADRDASAARNILLRYLTREIGFP